MVLLYFVQRFFHYCSQLPDKADFIWLSARASTMLPTFKSHSCVLCFTRTQTEKSGAEQVRIMLLESMTRHYCEHTDTKNNSYHNQDESPKH